MRAADFLDVARLHRKILEKRRLMNVIALLVPLINVASTRRNLVPLGILFGKIAVKFSEDFRRESGLHGVPDLAETRPEIAKESFFAVLILAKWIAGKIDVNSPGEGKGDNQRGRHQKIRFDMLMHAGFKIPISRKNRSCNQIVFVDRLLDVWMQRPRVADASRATVADEIESELVEICLESGLLQIIGNDARSGSERRFYRGIDTQTALDCFFRQQSSRNHHARVACVCAARYRGDQDAAVANVGTPM